MSRGLYVLMDDWAVMLGLTFEIGIVNCALWWETARIGIFVIYLWVLVEENYWCEGLIL